MAANSKLQKANKEKNDEFYTQLVDIELELKHYKQHFQNKVVFCNCDDPYESNFFKYFAMNFNFLGLKKLICTCYDNSPIAYTQLTLNEEFNTVDIQCKNRKAYKIEISEVCDSNGDGAYDLTDVKQLLKSNKNSLSLLKGNGDFRSEECIEFLKQADIVVTNPPFSLFREYVAQLIEYNKKFLIIGNKNAITYKEFFSLIMCNGVWIGYEQPTKFLNAKKEITNQVQGLCRWFTNLDIDKRHENLLLYKTYTAEEYPKYDNYNAININNVSDIPCDYDGVMGVPITFIDKYNPDQFEILGYTSGRNEFHELSHPTKRYINALQHNIDGTVANGSKANTRATLITSKPTGVYYTAENCKNKLTILYARILIRRKQNDN